MIHTNRIVTVGEQESIIDRPIVLYRGDREVEVEFTLVGNEFTFSEEGNVIKSVNASHGQLVLNTPSGEHMFSELAECHEGKVVFVVTKEMIDEFIEMGFYSFQIRLYDSAEMKSRVTIPPVMNGFDIRNPIAAEDETNVVDQGIVDYARIFKDQSNEELPTFTWDGEYIKTEWAHHDVITENKMNKIEDALYSINANVKESDVVMLNTLDQVKKDADAYVKEHMAEVEAEVDEFERNLNTDVQQFKIDTNAAMTAHKNEVGEVVDGFSGEIESINTQLAQIENNIIVITNSMPISDINAKLSNGGTFLFKGGTFLLDEGESITVTSNSRLIFEPNAIIKYNYNQSTNYTILDINSCENVIIEDAYLIGCRDTHVGADGEWGYGIGITASRNIKLIRPQIEKTWGDGIYIGYKWTEKNPSFITSNIEILNPYIYKCSRNGISICSVDNLLIDKAWIEGINRVYPKAGIDIEPECGTADLIHMSNITINNLTTKDNPAGIGIIMSAGETGCTGCKISVNNHINYGGTAISMWGDGGYEYEFSVNGGTYYDTPNIAISATNTGLASRKIFSDIKLIGKTKDSTGSDYSMHSAILLSINKDGDFGNILFSNILIDTKGYAYKFSNPFAVVKSGANTVTSQVQNINIENFRTTGSQGPMYLTYADLDTFEANNLYIPVTSNYYLRNLDRAYYTDFTYTNLVDWCSVNITELLPDGVYTIRVLKNNSRSVTISPGEGLSFANGATSYILREGEFRFIKTGTNITVLVTAYNGGFTSSE